MSPITTHVLDTTLGTPASGLSVVVEMEDAGRGWKKLGEGVTDADGRANQLLPPEVALAAGTYRLIFDTGGYLRLRSTQIFYPQVTVVFRARAGGHYHIPLLLSPYGYSTYRGS